MIEKELLKDSTTKSILSDISEHIPFYESHLQNVLLPLKNHKNFDKIEKKYEIMLTYSIMNLDFLVSVNNFLKSKFVWEKVVAFKQIYKMIFESHNKISYRFFIEANGIINPEKTQKFKNQSLWFGKMPVFINEESKYEYTQISDLIDKFKTNHDFSYIEKIRNYDGHYTNVSNCVNDLTSIDPDKSMRIAIEWINILREVNNFAFASLYNKLNSKE